MRLASFTIGIVSLALAWATSASAEYLELPPQTRLRLTSMQWMPTKGEYQAWPALSGEFAVSDGGTVTLPVIGAIETGASGPAGFAKVIAETLQQKMGLVNKPEVTVDVLEYPPVYIVGDVAKPGEYKYREGLTVLRAFAMSGGLPVTAGTGVNEPTRLAGELKATNNEILRSKVRIARLEAEAVGAPDFETPDSFDGVEAAQTAAIVAKEKIIFSARAKRLERQNSSVSELKELLENEIGVLEAKIKVMDATIDSAEKELVGVTQLVTKGIALASRKSEIERLIASYRSERLTLEGSIMRARQSISEASRTLDGQVDDQQTEVASELQAEQGKLEQATMRQALFQRLLVDAMASVPGAQAQNGPSFRIIRARNGESSEMDADESTLLFPGDVVRISKASIQQDSSPPTGGTGSSTSPPQPSTGVQGNTIVQ